MAIILFETNPLLTPSPRPEIGTHCVLKQVGAGRWKRRAGQPGFPFRLDQRKATGIGHRGIAHRFQTGVIVEMVVQPIALFLNAQAPGIAA